MRRLSVQVSDEEVLEALGTARRPLGLSGGRSTFQLLRETLFDTTDRRLAENGMTLRWIALADGTQHLELRRQGSVNLQGVVEETRVRTPVVGSGVYETLEGSSELASLVRSDCEPAALRPFLALDIDRELRSLRSWRFGTPRARLVLDRIVAQSPDATRSFFEVTLLEEQEGRGTLERLANRLRTGLGLGHDGLDTPERALQLLAGVGAASPSAALPHEVRLALLVLHAHRVALVREDSWTVPHAAGSGEELAREFFRETFPDVGDDPSLELVGFSPVWGGSTDLEVWVHELQSTDEAPEDFLWMPLLELMERAGGPDLSDPTLVSVLLLLARSEQGRPFLAATGMGRGAPTRLPVRSRHPGEDPGSADEDFIDLDLSILDFNQRVLELAEDPRVPLLERFFFLSVFSSNLDEFFVVRVGRAKLEAARHDAPDGGEPRAARLLDLVAIRVRALLARQYACLQRALLPALAERGVRIRGWDELQAAQKEVLSRTFREQIFPHLTPLALSASPGRSLPRLPSLGLSLATVMRDPDGGRPEYGSVAVPDDMARLTPIPDSSDLIFTADLIAAHADALFPSYDVRGVFPLRVSRLADVEIDEDSTGSLLEAVADEVEARRFKPVIRLEVTRSMPRDLRAYLLRELRNEPGTEGRMLGREDVYEVDGPLDLRCMSECTRLELPGGRFPPFSPRRPVPEDASIFDVIRERDLPVHHPYDDFRNTVGRFLAEAAEDPQVTSIKLTLYRTGKDSPVMEALLRALESGKDVSVFVELKARFDEESNIEWTHRLSEAGANVVYGVVGYKTHAKTALVVRREGEVVRRYVHVGTGNYNATTARLYTDLGLLSADPDLGADLHDFFNELTGSDRPPQREFRRILVAPNSLVQGLERLIRREVEHARAGRTARIQAKLNGLADREVVRWLYEASREGVEVDLIVRSICTLRPGVPGLSDGIRVRSILGRLLEHARIYYFENAGQGIYYIGSADWRARNLRRRVEVAAPVDDPAARAMLRRILDLQMEDPRAWVLRPDGVFQRLEGEGPGSQERFLQELSGS